jgi:hypothetical protein
MDGVLAGGGGRGGGVRLYTVRRGVRRVEIPQLFPFLVRVIHLHRVGPYRMAYDAETDTLFCGRAA